MRPRNCFTRDIRDHGKTVTYADGSRRIFFGDMPFGRKCQPPGPKCPDVEHAEGLPNMYEDRYKGPRKTYVDRVCTVCSRRVMIT